MSHERYPEQFKIEAVKQVTVADVAQRLGTTTHSLYAWIKRYGPDSEEYLQQSAESAEIRRLQKELKRVTEERDLFKKSRGVLRKPPRVRYAFIQEHHHSHSVRQLCQLFDVHPSGYYAWRSCAKSKRQRDNERLTGQLKQCWLESGGVYGYRKLHRDLRDIGEQHVVTPNRLERQFDLLAPNTAWVTDITYIKTHEGWLYLGAVMDLFSRRIIGWSMGSRITKELALDALLMAVWRRKPAGKVLVHSDQGSQYTSHDWSEFLSAHGLEGSMTRRGNCHDNAVAESFFQLLKRERIKRKIYATRDDAKMDVFNYIEMFYNPKRQHSSNDGLSPLEYERQYFNEAKSRLLK
ncbi:TPA: IS3 family transposase [Vibrio vulnificus]|uniref:IS3 family transposase n=1 Tax=Vibrio vulnificus TaxID=672 RepID=UPI0015943CC8|nr:IS3 family transposase [Vibrio vulnificus]EID4390600.1 IS3 family transposase [Vibrio vulnificus]NVC69942.1 IS3 family transposase [Vibrio vulnificus]HDY7525784.1 IS3 family transposase [Vibrio vulnificus]